MSLFLDTIQHPLRSKDDGRELRVSQAHMITMAIKMNLNS